MTTLPRIAFLGAIILAGCQGAPPESTSTTALEEQCKNDPASSACKELMRQPPQPGCDPKPCDNTADPSCVPPKPCDANVDPDCKPMPCVGSTDPNCQPPPVCDPLTGKNCPPPPCDPATGKDCPQPMVGCVCGALLYGKSVNGQEVKREVKVDLSGKPIADIKQCAEACHAELIDDARQLCEELGKPMIGTDPVAYVAISLQAYFGNEQLSLDSDAKACGSF
jgi:hypothetical protein